MKENQKDQQVSKNPMDQQNKDSQKKGENQTDNTTTMVEDAQTITEKEHREDKHQHDSKTPVGTQNRTDENASNKKSDASTGTENKPQAPDTQSKNTEKSL